MSSGTTSILFRVPARGVSRSKLLEFARQLQQAVAKGAPFCCLVTSDDELQALNKQFRGKDYPTDVLSFPAAGVEGRRSKTKGRSPFHNRAQADSLPYSGDIAISWDRTKAQALEYGHSGEQEIRILMLHGLLHLAGFDHETDRGQMARAEREWRKRFKLPSGVIERVRA